MIENMDANQLFQLIGSFGFPVAVATYLLIKLNPTIQEHTKALESLKDAIARICQKVGLDK